MTTKTYEESVSNFKKVSIDELRAALATDDKTIAFIGRPSCMYCQKLVSKLGPLQEETGAEVLYVETSPFNEDPEIIRFRQEFGIETVPSFIAQEGENLHVRNDSGMSVLEIKDFLTESLTYKEDVASYELTTVEHIKELISAKETFIMYIGKFTCPYCRRFVKKLSRVQAEMGWHIYHLNSIDPSQEAELKEFRAAYDIKTVPGFFYSKEGVTKVVCDSSLTEDEIKDFIN